MLVCALRPTAQTLVVVAAVLVVQSRGDFTETCHQIVDTLGCHRLASSVGHINTRLSISRTCRYSAMVLVVNSVKRVKERLIVHMICYQSWLK